MCRTERDPIIPVFQYRAALSDELINPLFTALMLNLFILMYICMS